MSDTELSLDPGIDSSEPGTITIEIPAGPAYSISPNSRKHWRVKHRESQELKQVAWASCLPPDRPELRLMQGPVNIHWTIYLGKGRRQMDRDNATATMKPALDGIVSAGAIEGDEQHIVRAITVDQVKWADHRGDARITVRIERAAA